MNDNSLEKFIYSFGGVAIVSLILSVKLVDTNTSPIITGLQVIIIQLYIYWFHRLLHSLPEYYYNYHIFSHHDKQLELDRPIELLFEFITNFSWFLILIVFQYIFNIHMIPDILIIFIGLWYSSAHVLNYSVIPNYEHKIHHTEMNYNYGPHFIDFIFGTLKAEEGYTMNGEIINGIVIYLLLSLIK